MDKKKIAKVKRKEQEIKKIPHGYKVDESKKDMFCKKHQGYNRKK